MPPLLPAVSPPAFASLTWQTLRATFKWLSSDAVNGLFSGSGLGKHFRASDADYIVSDFVGVVGDPAQLSSPLKEAP